MDTLGDFKLGMVLVTKTDTDCRGVGRPQVVMHSQLPRFLVNLIYSNIRMVHGVHRCRYVDMGSLFIFVAVQLQLWSLLSWIHWSVAMRVAWHAFIFQ